MKILINQKKVLIEHLKNKELLLQQLQNKKIKKCIPKENKIIHQPVKYPLSKNKGLIHKIFILNL